MEREESSNPRPSGKGVGWDLVFYDFDPLPQALGQFFQHRETHLHTITPEEERTLVRVRKVIKPFFFLRATSRVFIAVSALAALVASIVAAVPLHRALRAHR